MKRKENVGQVDNGKQVTRGQRLYNEDREARSLAQISNRQSNREVQ